MTGLLRKPHLAHSMPAGWLFPLRNCQKTPAE
jgi:hypothetical protein